MNDKSLHIVHGGVDNGDKARLEKAARDNSDFKGWTVPKSVRPDDDVVIYVGGYGFFATAIVKGFPKPSTNRQNRYSAPLTAIKLIKPPISLGSIRKHIPNLSWINFPRSITTPDAGISNQIRAFINRRRKIGADIDNVKEANIEELREIAIKASQPSIVAKPRTAFYRAGSDAIKRYVLLRSKGICEGCQKPAPFKRGDGTPYLEPHHTHRRADDGPDHPAYVIALCPNCHRRAEYSIDSKIFNEYLIKMLSKLEPK
jgi:hypothetical protein